MPHRVRFGPEARADLLDLYDHIADAAGRDLALAYVERIEHTCVGLADFPYRGAPRDDIRPGLRVIGIERRTLIAYIADASDVTILRVLHGGRDVAALE